MRQHPPARLPPRDELVNVLEFEEAARLTLPAAVHATIAGGDRAAFERITFRPRMMVPALDMDLSVELFGDTHFTPILVGPVADQQRYHTEGELATVKGASAARAAMVVSSRSSVPVADIAARASVPPANSVARVSVPSANSVARVSVPSANSVAQAKTPLWYSVYAAGEANAPARVRQAVAAGCKAVCITIGASLNGSRVEARPRTDWKAVDQIRRDLNVPVLIKGVMTPDEARRAVENGAQGLVVSNHGGAASSPVATIDALPSIVDAVGQNVPVLVDGSFRRNSDIVKALAFGARAVLVARPVMWALAAYGADGVQTMIELLQSDVARNMGALGAPTLKALTRGMVKVHPR